MKDECLAHLLALVETARKLLNREARYDCDACVKALEIELVRAENYLADRSDFLKRRPLTEGSTMSNRRDTSQNTSARPASPPPIHGRPHNPVRIVRPAPGKSSLTSEQIQAAVKKVSKKIKDKRIKTNKT